MVSVKLVVPPCPTRLLVSNEKMENCGYFTLRKERNRQIVDRVPPPDLRPAGELIFYPAEFLMA